MIEKPKQPPSSNSSDESSEPEESESKVKRQKMYVLTLGLLKLSNSSGIQYSTAQMQCHTHSRVFVE